VESVPSFVERLMNLEGIPKDKLKEIKVMRLPSYRSRQLAREKDERQLMGRYSPKKGLMELYPLLVWQDEKKPLSEEDMDVNKKLGEIGIHTIKTLFHEVLHIKHDDKREENEVKNSRNTILSYIQRPSLDEFKNEFEVNISHFKEHRYSRKTEKKLEFTEAVDKILK